jgi:hypothetical protein
MKRRQGIDEIENLIRKPFYNTTGWLFYFGLITVMDILYLWKIFEVANLISKDTLSFSFKKFPALLFEILRRKLRPPILERKACRLN